VDGEAAVIIFGFITFFVGGWIIRGLWRALLRSIRKGLFE
jgi:hypothetical protein